MLCLSLPAFGGHTLGGGSYCECNTPGCVEDYPGECDRAATNQDETPKDVTSELGIAIVALLLWLRLKA